MSEIRNRIIVYPGETNVEITLKSEGNFSAALFYCDILQLLMTSANNVGEMAYTSLSHQTPGTQ